MWKLPRPNVKLLIEPNIFRDPDIAMSTWDHMETIYYVSLQQVVWIVRIYISF